MWFMSGFAHFRSTINGHICVLYARTLVNWQNNFLKRCFRDTPRCGAVMQCANSIRIVCTASGFRLNRPQPSDTVYVTELHTWIWLSHARVQAACWSNAHNKIASRFASLIWLPCAEGTAAFSFINLQNALLLRYSCWIRCTISGGVHWIASNTTQSCAKGISTEPVATNDASCTADIQRLVFLRWAATQPGERVRRMENN